MSASPGELGLYALAIFILFITPGPVWVAVIARTLQGGARQALPLALAVTVGDVVWSMGAVLGMALVVQAIDGVLMALKIAAAAMFLTLGLLAIRHALRDRPGLPARDGRLARPGFGAGFTAGLAVIFTNPKAMLFYAGLLPGFFDLTRLTRADIAAIALISAIVPFLGNMALALSVDRARRLATSPAAIRRMNLTAGFLFIAVAVAIPFT